MTTRTALLFAVALAPLGAGPGCSHNPGYFPYYLPGGRIVQEHAKPRFGYFKNFDPQACRIEITPSQQITAPLGSQVVLVGSVLDKDGQPRRSRRIEWLLDGNVGNIIEADESGVYPGRGYKVDNKYAVTYTNYTTKPIPRGNNDPADDVVVAPGQTFCVISSSVPGETVVTGYAPEVFNWENGRVVVRITWGDGRFNFPPPAVVRYGGEHTLTTVVAPGPDAAPSGYRIRYTVLDGPPTVLVARGGSGTGASQSGTGGKEAETFTDASGEAAVRLVQHDPKPGKTRVAIEIVKPPETGTGPGVVIAKRETVIEWAEPRLNLAVSAPNTAAVAATFPVTVSLENVAGVDSKNAQVKVTLSDGATLARSDPPPNRQDAAGALMFDIPPVSGNGKQEITLQVKPARVGPVTVAAEVASDGLRATGRATTRVEQGKLQLHVEVPSAALVGERIPFRLVVTNAGAAPAENVTVWAKFDPGLVHPSPDNPVELAAGTIAPGQTTTLDLPLTAKTTGRFGLRATATGDGNLLAGTDPVAVDVRKAELGVTATGPRLAYLNQEFAWTVTAANTGDAPVSNVIVRAAIPPEVRVKTADGGRVSPGSVEWKLPELRPGDRKAFTVSADTMKLTDRAALTVTASGDPVSGTRPAGEPVEARADSAVAIAGTAAVVLELATPPGLVEVGKRATFTARVKNQGTVSARDVVVTAFPTAELHPVRATGPRPGDEARIDGTGQIAFPRLDELRPGETLTFTVEVEAVRAGDARFRTEVKAAHLTNPLKEEQAARVIAK